MKRRRRHRPSARFARPGWTLVALGVAAHLALPHVHALIRKSNFIAYAWSAAALGAVFVLVRARRWILRRRRIRAVAVSERRRDYVFEDADYHRGNAKENAYRRVMHLTLLKTFDNRCAKCGARDDGVDLDHFFWPKNEGGCFIMRHAGGHVVNNAIPLCVHCNRSKSDSSYRDFFRADQLPWILEKNAAMTKLLNQRSPLDDRGRARPRVRRGGGAAA